MHPKDNWYKRITAWINRNGASEKKTAPINLPIPFFRFIVTDKSCLRFLLASVVITTIYFIVLRILFLADSSWWDSIHYIQAAANGLEVSLRPQGYSNFISFFHIISRSDGILIFAQYIANIIANLFFFFTLLYFFPLRKSYRVLLFVLLIGNPLYALYSNYILSDAIFCSLSVIWFTVLLWIMCRPSWIYFFVELALFYWLFLLRYNALIYPFIFAVAYMLSKQAIWKKIICISITFLLMIEIIISTIHKTEYKTGVATFSALGGWQLANNAMFVLKHVEFDSTTFSSKTSKELSVFIKHYYSSRKAMDTLNTYEDTDINAQFIWNRVSPLRLYEKYYFLRLYSLKSYDIHLSDETSKRYIFFDAHTISWGANGPEYVLIKRQPEYYLESFTTMGPVFNEFGTEVIKKYPLEYLRYFIWPNIISYIHPPMEAYVNYNHYLPYRPLLISFYDFTSNDFSRTHEKWITEFMYPWSWIFTIINVLFLLLVVAYYFKHGYKSDLWFNQCLAFYTFFYISNFLFSILVAPNYFRYHVAIVTLCMAFIIYLWERVFGTEKKIIKDN